MNFEDKECLRYFDHQVRNRKVYRLCLEYVDTDTQEHGEVWVTPEQLRAWPSAYALHGRFLDGLVMDAYEY